MPTNPNMRILLVDDMATMRKIERGILKQLGYENIQEAENGKIALHLMQKEKIDFLLTDWNMPEMSGLDLVRAVRADPNLKATPILMVTAEAKREQVMEAIKAGVNNYVVKPFTPAILGEKISAMFK